MEGANKMIKNIALVGAFCSGAFALVTEANAQSVYDNNSGTKSVTLSPGMSPGSVPQADIKVEAGGVSTDSGNANSGGVQVQNVTVQAQSTADAENKNASTSAADAINKARSDAEETNNALLLQQIELDRLKAEQDRITAINKFGDAINDKPVPTPLPVVPPVVDPVAPVVPVAPAAPVIENNNTIINDSQIVEDAKNVKIEEAPAVEIEEEVASGGSFFSRTKWGVSPLLGMRWYNSGTMANVENKYILGLGVSAEISKWVIAEFTYIYGEDDLSGFACVSLCGGAPWYVSTRSTHEWVIGAKIGPKMNSFRPFLALGIGYITQNYDYYNGDISTNNMSGNIGGGVDFEISKNFMVGARADYQTIFGGGSNQLVDGFNTFDQVYGDESGRYRIGATATYTF